MLCKTQYKRSLNKGNDNYKPVTNGNTKQDKYQSHIF